MMKTKISYLFLIFVLVHCMAIAQKLPNNIKQVNVDSGWANNSVNTVIFRKNSLVTFKDTQYIAYYDNNKHVVLGKRKSGTAGWVFNKTSFTGNAADAHNSISIMVDGAGYLHLAWDHHNVPLRYCKSISPGSLEMTAMMPMTGLDENNVSYPEFYKMPNGNLLFLYRKGASGNGSLVINKYDTKTSRWKQLQNNLIDGEGKRNAYWQACVDAKGTIHVSWVWRETADVASNHDMCYAASSDGGISWHKSTGEKYTLPINATTAEYISIIPSKSELINQTSICADESGNAYIATYFKDKADSIPQFHIIYKKDHQWKTLNLGFRKTAFTLSGMGTKRIPISRPQIIEWKKNIAVIFRDTERGDKVSMAVSNNLANNKWKLLDLTNDAVGSWEPSFDTELWNHKKQLNLFIQKTEQIDGEGKATIAPQMVKVLEWNPKK